MIVLTGAAGGIGRSLAGQLAEFDTVLATYNRRIPSPSGLDSRVRFAALDLLSEQRIDAFVAEHNDELQRITVVHCAATSIDKLVVHYDSGNWDEVMNVNLRGNFLLTRALVRLMVRQRWGRIIHISSVIGNEGAPGAVAYSASKSGLLGMSRVLAKEYGRFGVTSNVLCLGYFDAGLIATLPLAKQDEIRARIPSRKFGSVVEVSRAIYWLTQAEYVNGAVINIDGGL